MNIAAATLLFACGAGSQEVHQGYETIYKNYQPKVSAYFQPRVSHREDVEDLAQDTFLRLWLGRKNFTCRVMDGDHLKLRFDAWLFGITRNVFLEYLDKPRRSRSLERDDSFLSRAPNTDLQARLEREEVSAALRCLQPKSAEVLKAEYFPGNPGHLLRLGTCSRNAYHQRLSRARRELREVLLRRIRA
jgi:RNA polymerase sigma factor (sigma-70 family)